MVLLEYGGIARNHEEIARIGEIQTSKILRVENGYDGFVESFHWNGSVGERDTSSWLSELYIDKISDAIHEGYGPIPSSILSATLEGTRLSNSETTRRGSMLLTEMYRQYGRLVLLVGHVDLIDVLVIGKGITSLCGHLGRPTEIVVPAAATTFFKKQNQPMRERLESMKSDFADLGITLTVVPISRPYDEKMMNQGVLSVKDYEKGIQGKRMYLEMILEDAQGRIWIVAPGAGLRSKYQENILNTGVARLMETGPVMYLVSQWKPKLLGNIYAQEVKIHPWADVTTKAIRKLKPRDRREVLTTLVDQRLAFLNQLHHQGVSGYDVIPSLAQAVMNPAQIRDYMTRLLRLD